MYNIAVNNYEMTMEEDVESFVTQNYRSMPDIFEAISYSVDEAMNASYSNHKYNYIKNGIEDLSGMLFNSSTERLEKQIKDVSELYKEEIMADGTYDDDYSEKSHLSYPYSGFDTDINMGDFNSSLNYRLGEITILTQADKEKTEGQSFLFNDEGEPEVQYAQVVSLYELVKRG